MQLGTPIRAAAVAALVCCLALAARGGFAAELEAQPQTIVISASDVSSRSVALGINKSVVIDFPRDIKDVLVANPKIARNCILTLQP